MLVQAFYKDLLAIYCLAGAEMLMGVFKRGVVQGRLKVLAWGWFEVVLMMWGPPWVISMGLSSSGRPVP
eukprot:7831123-Karenia_brevis.AAC.1